MKQALLYSKNKDRSVRCSVCSHRCTIQPGKRGVCGVRENRSGKLYLLVYGKAISEAIDPIEKKPFFHFLPGSRSLSIATVGCNFRCDNCQNWQISQASKGSGYTDLEILGDDLPPEKVVRDAIENKCESVSYTYTEPTIWMDYALDCMKLAKKAGLRNCWVSNGYMSDETLDCIIPYLDAINVDLKFFDTKKYQRVCGGSLEPIVKNLKTLKQRGIWVEITTLSIPTLSDGPGMFRAMAKFIKSELGEETPWHISAFSPDISYKLKSLPATSAETLQRAYEIGKKVGLRYVYTGNIPGLESENTYCSVCNTLCIQRYGYRIIRRDVDGICPNCKTSINLIS
ncbi:MAG: AmmeMemoRadiSam system radical SAM enzyme [Patescibacteria group bacterium]|nr:AmmeMemoRadiSam system radical SAM enzyme [Patescibacteria group bacterium]